MAEEWASFLRKAHENRDGIPSARRRSTRLACRQPWHVPIEFDEAKLKRNFRDKGFVHVRGFFGPSDLVNINGHVRRYIQEVRLRIV